MVVQTDASTIDSKTLRAGYGLAIRLAACSSFKLINTYGTQVVDVWAISAEEPFEYSSMDHTRSFNSSIFVEQGMVVVSDQRRAMLRLLEDTSPGRHDTLLCPCNAAIYRELGCKKYHRSCADNLHEALSAVGRKLPFTPASLNMFMNVLVREDGNVDRRPPASKPGDYVLFRVETDVIVVLSACPQDITPINGVARKPQDIALEILPAAGGRHA